MPTDVHGLTGSDGQKFTDHPGIKTFPQKPRSPKLKVYKDTAGEWRWSLRSTNGRVIADSGEGYKRQMACLSAAHKVQTAWQDAVIDIAK